MGSDYARTNDKDNLKTFASKKQRKIWSWWFLPKLPSCLRNLKESFRARWKLPGGSCWFETWIIDSGNWPLSVQYSWNVVEGDIWQLMIWIMPPKKRISRSVSHMLHLSSGRNVLLICASALARTQDSRSSSIVLFEGLETVRQKWGSCWLGRSLSLHSSSPSTFTGRR